MKTVKFLSLTLLVSLFCVGMAFAQQQDRPQPQDRTHQQQDRKVDQKKEFDQMKDQKRQGPTATIEERAAKQVEGLKESLNLNADQVNKLQDLQTQFIKEQEEAVKSKQAPEEKDIKAKMDAYDAQVKAILTADQYNKYIEQRAARMNRDGAKPGKGEVIPGKGDAKPGKAKEISKEANQGNLPEKRNNDKKTEKVQKK